MTIFRPSTATVLAMTTFLTAVGQAAAAPVVTEIELGQSGVAHYTMVETVNGPSLSFTVPESAASDIIASLVVRDPSGGVVDLQTETPGSVDAALQGTPFEAGLPRDLASMLDLLIGQPVSLMRVGGTVSGTMIGVRPGVNGSPDSARHATALIFDGSALVEVVLAPGVNVEMSPQSTQRLAQVLGGLQGGADQRRFDLTLSGSDTRDVSLSYVTEAPAWKNSYRLLLDEGRLQGWATFENLSGHDWRDVDLTLSTGTPIAYRSHLITPQRIARPDLTSPVSEGIPSNRRNSGGGGMFTTMSPAPVIAAEEHLDSVASGTATEFEARNAGGVLRYEMPMAISLETGRTANLMYFDAPIEPKLHALYRPAQHDKAVFVAVALHPDQGLAPGIISVQNAGGFVGDTPFPGIIADQRTLLPVAAAVGAEVVQDQTVAARLNGMTYSGDRLFIDSVRFVKTTYDTPVPATLALFTVEHPGTFGELESTNGAVVRKPDGYQVSVPVKDGHARVEITETEAFEREMTISASSIGRVLSELKSEQIEAPEAMVASLRSVHALLVQQAGNEEQLKELSTQYTALQEEQQRLRKNLEVGLNEALRARYVQSMENTETRILKTLEAQDALRIVQTALKDRIEAMLLTF